MRIPHEPYQKLKGYLVEHKLRYQDLADYLGCEVATISNKINGTSDFTLSECVALKHHFGIPLDLYC